MPIGRSPEQSLKFGKFVGNYTIVCPVRLGAMGAAYLARHKITDQRTYLKVLGPHEHVPAPDAAGFSSDHFVSYSVFNDSVEGVRCTVLEHRDYYVGVPLLPVLADENEQAARMDPDGETVLALDRKTALDYWRVFRDLVESVSRARSGGVPYVGITPYELFYVGTDDRFRIVDAGIDIDPGNPGYSFDALDPHSLAYQAPERVKAFREGQPVERVPNDERTEVFSLGMTAYQLLTGARAGGELPYAAGSAQEIAAELVDRRGPLKPLPLRPFNQRALKLITRCLEKNPAKRFPDLGALMAAMDAIADPMTPDPVPRGVKVTALVAATFVVGVTAWSGWRVTRPYYEFFRGSAYDQARQAELRDPAEVRKALKEASIRLDDRWIVEALEARIDLDTIDLDVQDERDRALARINEALRLATMSGAESPRDPSMPAFLWGAALDVRDDVSDLLFWRAYLTVYASDAPATGINELSSSLAELREQAGDAAGVVRAEGEGLGRDSSAGACLIEALRLLHSRVPVTDQVLEDIERRLAIASTGSSHSRPFAPVNERWTALQVLGSLARSAGRSKDAHTYFLQAAKKRAEVTAAPHRWYGFAEALSAFVSAARSAGALDLLVEELGFLVADEHRNRAAQQFADYARLTDVYLDALVESGREDQAFDIAERICNGSFLDSTIEIGSWPPASARARILSIAASKCGLGHRTVSASTTGVPRLHSGVGASAINNESAVDRRTRHALVKRALRATVLGKETSLELHRACATLDLGALERVLGIVTDAEQVFGGQTELAQHVQEHVDVLCKSLDAMIAFGEQHDNGLASTPDWEQELSRVGDRATVARYLRTLGRFEESSLETDAPRRAEDFLWTSWTLDPAQPGIRAEILARLEREAFAPDRSCVKRRKWLELLGQLSATHAGRGDLQLDLAKAKLAELREKNSVSSKKGREALPGLLALVEGARDAATHPASDEALRETEFEVLTLLEREQQYRSADWARLRIRVLRLLEESDDGERFDESLEDLIAYFGVPGAEFAETVAALEAAEYAGWLDDVLGRQGRERWKHSSADAFVPDRPMPRLQRYYLYVEADQEKAYEVLLGVADARNGTQLTIAAANGLRDSRAPCVPEIAEILKAKIGDDEAWSKTLDPDYRYTVIFELGGENHWQTLTSIRRDLLELCPPSQDYPSFPKHLPHLDWDEKPAAKTARIELLRNLEEMSIEGMPVERKYDYFIARGFLLIELNRLQIEPNGTPIEYSERLDRFEDAFEFLESAQKLRSNLGDIRPFLADKTQSSTWIYEYQWRAARSLDHPERDKTEHLDRREWEQKAIELEKLK